MRKNFKEDKQNFVKNSDFGYSELTIIKKVLENSFDDHWHDYFEIKLITKGKGTVVINGEKHIFNKGSLYLIMPSNIHAFYPENRVELYNITMQESIIFDESIIKKLSAFSKLFFQLSEEEYQQVFYIMELLKNERHNHLDYEEQITRNLLESLLLILIRKSSKNYILPDNYSVAVQIAISYIKMHFREDITTQTVASILGFSTGYFSTLFHKKTGVTFVNYLNNQRLEYAKKLLCYDKYSVNDVWRMSGFRSYSNFIKAFKNKYGLLPKDMQKKS